MINISVTVDRIEGKLAVLDVMGTAVDWPLSALPAGTSEGDQVAFQIQLQDDDGAHARGEARLERLRAQATDDNDIDL